MRIEEFNSSIKHRFHGQYYSYSVNVNLVAFLSIEVFFITHIKCPGRWAIKYIILRNAVVNGAPQRHTVQRNKTIPEKFVFLCTVYV